MQHDALSAEGCDKIFDEKNSGASARLPGREELLEYVRPGDVVVVWKLEIVTSLKERGVGLRSLHESIDTTTPAGKLSRLRGAGGV